MNREAALKLKTAAWNAAECFSGDREFNPGRESFTVVDGGLTVLSDDVAYVLFEKTGGKRAVAFFYFLRTNGGCWRYFFPTDSHLDGMRNFLESKVKMMVEQHNLPLNYEEKSVVVKT